MSSYIEIIGCDGTALYENDNHSIRFNTSGRLQILIAYDGGLILRLNTFEYEVKSQDEIIIDRNDPQFKMILYLRKYPMGKWIFKINQHADEIYSCLNQKCYIVEKEIQKKQYSYSDIQRQQKRQIQSKQKNNKRQKKQKKEKAQQKNEEKKQIKAQNIYKQQQPQNSTQTQAKKVTTHDILVGTSKGLGWGLKLVGKVLSKGFQAVGTLASMAVKPAAQKIEISQNTKANLQLAKKTTGTVFGFAATQVGNLIHYGKQAATNISERIQKTETGQQMQQNPRYQSIKSGTKTGVQVVANLYEGVVQAVYDVGSGISKGTTKVVSKKYGDQAGQAADDALEGVGNIIKIGRIPQDEVAKALK